MVTTHNLGFPRIGDRRQLKTALEAYWQNQIEAGQLQETARLIRAHNLQLQAGLDWVPVGDFSLYDHVLDTSRMFGHYPARFESPKDISDLDRYFLIARGRGSRDGATEAPAEMTKWFDTNYHYLVPEWTRESSFRCDPAPLLEQIGETDGSGIKPVILGPVSFLKLGKSVDGCNPLVLLDRLLNAYDSLFASLIEAGIEWLQIDEPILVTDLTQEWRHALHMSYHRFQRHPLKLLLTTYFAPLGDNLRFACELPVAGLHVDLSRGRDELASLIDWLPAHKILSLGVLDGRNVWKSDLNALLDWLEPVHERLAERIWIAPSCSLLHLPVDLRRETALDPELSNWLSFAVQKLGELQILAKALNQGRPAVAEALNENARAIRSRRESTRIHNARVQQRLERITPDMGQRSASYAVRRLQQQQTLHLPPLPTTTIGSFPQTGDIRRLRRGLREGSLTPGEYRERLRQEIADTIRQQEAIGLDVLVHGEPERNDMVEYFAEHLQGYAVTRHAWVQSYGSRCVKPPILFGDVERPTRITVEWTRYAQSLTERPVKGMLSGPVTLLNWSFVRDDQPLASTAMQLALALRDEVLDLEAAGARIIQIDEAALREGLPLRRANWQEYLEWALKAFRLTANGVAEQTQIHTHMCYSRFNDIIETISAMDADVITLENARSADSLLDVFDSFDYPSEIGPGVYDIHSTNIPDINQMCERIRAAARRIPAERLWINPDCGLKTRQWQEVIPALQNMQQAAQLMRKELFAQRPDQD
ncbi:MAG: 5-methyltetrahydropteroyltriglutamate--homocysteine S-methyltransferase [Candidatus Thiodiazotropha sp.]